MFRRLFFLLLIVGGCATSHEARPPLPLALSRTSDVKSNPVYKQLSVVAASPPSSAEVKLEWSAPNSSDDYSPLMYNVYIGGASRLYTNLYSAGTNLSLTLTGLDYSDTYFFAVTTLSAEGVESDFSSEFAYTPETPYGWALLPFRFKSNTADLENARLESSTNLIDWRDDSKAVKLPKAAFLYPLSALPPIVFFRAKLYP